jgi:serine phosphatase RsbU (regulator of sigma subunit)
MATVLIVDLDKSGATIASAGHPYPIVFGSPFDRDRAMGPLLGVLAPEPYESAPIELGVGDRMAIFTDGLDPAGVAAGGNPPPWFMELAGDLNDEPLSKISERLRKAAEAALGPQPPDDWTFVLIEKRPEA